VYYINTQSSDPVRYSTTITSSFYNVTQINDYQAFQYATPDPKNFWMPAGTPKCVQISVSLKDIMTDSIVRRAMSML
jgi:hypothetical protein